MKIDLIQRIYRQNKVEAPTVKQLIRPFSIFLSIDLLEIQQEDYFFDLGDN